MKQELEDSFARFAMAVLDAVRERAKRQSPTEIPYIYNEFRNGDVVSAVRFRKDYFAIFPSYKDEDFPKALADDCANRLFDSGFLPPSKFTDNEGRPITNPTREMELPHVRSDIVRIVWATLTKYSLDASEKQFREEFAAAVAAWQRRVGSTKSVVPLPYFACALDKIAITDGLTLQKVTDDQRTEIWNSFPFIQKYLLDREFADVECFLVIDDAQFKNENIVEFVDAIVTALRLLKPGVVGTHGIFSAAQTPASTIRGGYTPRPDIRVPPSLRTFPQKTSLSLLESDMATFKDLFNLLQANNFSAFKLLHLPISRLNKSYERDDDSDKIIDLCIALESSLLYGTNEELSYRLAFRAAELLSPSRDSKRTFGFIRALYAERSKIVHSGMRFPSEALAKDIKRKMNVGTNEFISEIEMIVRETLRRLLTENSSGRSLVEICEGLDANILRRMQAESSKP